MLNFLTVNTFIEFVCFIIAVICLSGSNSLIWRLQILYIFITCVTEVAGIYISQHKFNNHWIYNIFILLEAGFTYLMFACLYKKYINSKPVILPGLAIFILVYGYSIALHGFFLYAYPAFIVMSVQFVLYSMYFFYLLLKDDHYIDLKYSPSFWWAAGVLFFYFANTTSNIFDEKLYTIKISAVNQHLTYFIYEILNIVLYTTWCYSFICKKWLTTISETS